MSSNIIDGFRLGVYYVGYLIYLVSCLGCFWLFMSGIVDGILALCLFVVSMVGLILCIAVLLENKEEVEYISNVIIPKKIRRKFKKLYNRYFRDDYI